MKKGRFGIVLAFYPLLAFAFVIFKLPVLCAAITAVAIFVEKDEWAGRQSLQALFLSFSVFIIDKLISLLKMIFSFPVISGFFGTVFTVFGTLCYIAAIIISIMAILKVLKDQEVEIPFLADLSYKAYGKIKPRPVYTAPPQQTPPPVQPQAPVPPQPTATVAPPEPPSSAAPTPPPVATPAPPTAPIENTNNDTEAINKNGEEK